MSELPSHELVRLLVAAERTFGPDSPTVRVLFRELANRAEARAFTLRVCDRLYAAHEVLAHRAERRGAAPWWEQALVAEGGCPL